jgi:hypothetical protein
MVSPPRYNFKERVTMMASFQSWFHAPFQSGSNISVFQLVLGIGLIMVIIMFWMMILGHMREALT